MASKLSLLPGAITLTTSAPRNASTSVADGPATWWVRSSTRTPSSALIGADHLLSVNFSYEMTTFMSDMPEMWVPLV